MMWSFVLAGVGVFGLWLAGRKNSAGWLVGLGAQFLWAAYALATHQYGFLLSCLGYGWVYAKNYLAWRYPPVLRECTPEDVGLIDPPPTGWFTKHAWNRWYNRQLEPVDD